MDVRAPADGGPPSPDASGPPTGVCMIAAYGFHFEQPWWLLTALLVGPVVYLAWRSLRTFGVARRVLAIALRAVVVALLALAMARPAVTQTHDRLTLLTVLDRSQSVPQDLQAAAHRYLKAALADKPVGDQLAVIDVAEEADIVRLPSTAGDVPKRTLSLRGGQSRLAAGVQMALAIAPPNTSVRIILISDGNETAGDLKAVARRVAASRIPIDVLPLHYRYDNEVVCRRLVAPGRARSGQTIPLRFVLSSTHEAAGHLLLTLNGLPVDLDPGSDAVMVPVELRAGTNVHTVSLPVGTRGVHEFEAKFLPADPNADRLDQNNRASAVTFVAGPGHVLIVAANAAEAEPLANALREAKIDVRSIGAGELPRRLTSLLDADAVVLVNTPNHEFSMAQQEMICRYVTDLGGGLVTIGGPESYGAGGWIGSPVARILPVDMDPPQKKQMPKGALVLIMHACEMPRGNYWGKRVAIEAVKTLSRHDLVGVVDYSWNAGMKNWVFQLQKAGNKKDCIAAIGQMVMGDMPDFGPPVTAAYHALKNVRAGQKHIIIVSDGDPQMPSNQVLQDLRKERITVSCAGVFPHTPQDLWSLRKIAGETGGRFREIKDPQQLPKFFIKEAQVVRRSLIIEDTFTPQVLSGTNEILRGLRGVPRLDGRVLTGPKRGLNEILLAAVAEDKSTEPILATTQAGLGRVASFTSSADSRWAKRWVGWGGFGRFWEQTVRWVAKSPQASDCEAFADVQGRNVTLTVEAIRPGGEFVQFADLTGQVITPKMKSKPLGLRQIGPGQYRAQFQALEGGSYLVNLRYRRAGEDQKLQLVQTVVNVPFEPEFEDLTDNAALLRHVADTTGGRMLPNQPEKADLFSRAGLSAPRAFVPLTKPLFLAWVILFLLDVAIRRIAIDLQAIARRLGVQVTDLAVAGACTATSAALVVLVCFGVRFFGLHVLVHVAAVVALLAAGAVVLFRGVIFSKVQAVESATLSALKQRREKVRQRLAGGKDLHARRRFVADKGAESALPTSDVHEPARKPRPETKPQPKQAQTPEESETHVSRLLDAKRRAKRQRGED